MAARTSASEGVWFRQAQKAVGTSLAGQVRGFRRTLEIPMATDIRAIATQNIRTFSGHGRRKERKRDIGFALNELNRAKY
jgi:hypothetical protein